MQTRTPDEIAEALAIQKMTVERIIIREANRIEQKLVGDDSHLLDEVPC